MAVVERHKGTGNVGLGLVQGFGLARGAIATSVAHDSHNIAVVGVSDEEMLAAVLAVKQMGGCMPARNADTGVGQRSWRSFFPAYQERPPVFPDRGTGVEQLVKVPHLMCGIG